MYIMLMNYSRLDLRPRNKDGPVDGSAGEDSLELPPPLDAEANEGQQVASQRNRRASRLLDLHRLRNASIEERIEILRRHRSQQQETSQHVDHEGESAERQHHAKLADRLRDKFRIRTRTQSSGRISPNLGASST